MVEPDEAGIGGALATRRHRDNYVLAFLTIQSRNAQQHFAVS